MKQIIKRLNKSHFFYFVIICLMLDFFIIVHNVSVDYPQIYEHKDIYEKKFNFIEGYVDEDKFKSLVSYGEKLNGEIEKLSELASEYRTGKINTIQFKESAKLKKQLLYQQDLYDEVYERYISLLETQNNYFTDVNGFNNLFETTFSIPLIVFITYMVSVLFVKDNETGVTDIYESTPMRKIYFRNRILIICVLSLAFLFIHELFKLFYINFTLGFGNGVALISSSSMFEKTIFQTNFYETYSLYFFIKFLGCIFSSVLLCAIGKKINYILYFIMIVLCLFLFPYLVINNQKILNYLLWIGLNQPIYYFLGTKINAETQGIIFSNFSYNEILIIIIASILIILILTQIFKRRTFTSFLVLTLLLSGCANHKSIENNNMNINNSMTKKGFCANDIYTFDTSKQIMFENQDKNNKYAIERDIFVDDYQLSCGDTFNKDYYYIITTPAYYQIKRLDTDNFTTEILYEYRISNEDKLFKDVLDLYRSPNNSTIELPRFIIANNDYLSIIYNKKIGIFDLKQKKFVNYVEDIVYQNNMSLCDDSLYYIDSAYQLKKVSLTENKSIIVSDQFIESFFLDENHIYYKSLNENKIYLMSNDDKVTSLNIQADYFFVKDKYLYYIDMNDMFAYQYNLETKEKTNILNKEIYTFQVHQNYIIFTFFDDKSNEIEIDTIKIKQIDN